MPKMTAERAVATLAKGRIRFLAELEHFDEANFFAPPPRGGWAAAHVVEHVARVETRIQQGARKVLEHGSDDRPSWYDPLLKLPMRSGVVQFVRVRAVRGADPLADGGVAGMSRAQLLERLATVRAATIGLLGETRDRDLSRIYMRHPYFGAFPVRDFLAWSAWHEERHRKQLARILGAFGAR